MSVDSPRRKLFVKVAELCESADDESNRRISEDEFLTLLVTMSMTERAQTLLYMTREIARRREKGYRTPIEKKRAKHYEGKKRNAGL